MKLPPLWRNNQAMPEIRPWWINFAGVGFGLVVWMSTALLWCAGMAIFYGVFVLLGPQAMIVCGVVAFACHTYYHAARHKLDDEGPDRHSDCQR